ncbi:MAG: energy-coupled thiamine transporter ThiT [Clostridiales bacterium]|nr:energy-coupled thiamine transporter ThiT [Clostridiales bacterium]
MKKSSKWTTKMLVTAAICMAMSYLLSFVRLWTMPMGGSITAVSMLPLMLFAWIYGVVPGMTAGCAFGRLQLIQDPQIYHWIQVLFDYPVAFAMLGLAGCFRKHKDAAWALPAGVVLACFGRFLCHFFTGVVYFGEYAPTQTFWGIIGYSAGYNGGYMGFEAVLSAIVSALPPIKKMIAKIETL